MPTYEYRCNACGRRFEKFQGINDLPEKSCPSCGGPARRLISAGAGTGAVRWSGEAPPDRFRLLRRQLADREVPVTLERAPWELRRVVGHFGAYQEGVGRLVGKLRETFDPGSLLSVALEGAHGD